MMEETNEKKCIICLEDDISREMCKCHQCVAYTCYDCSVQMYNKTMENCPHCGITQPGTPWLNRFKLRECRDNFLYEEVRSILFPEIESDTEEDHEYERVRSVLFPEIESNDENERDTSVEILGNTSLF